MIKLLNEEIKTQAIILTNLTQNNEDGINNAHIKTVMHRIHNLENCLYYWNKAQE